MKNSQVAVLCAVILARRRDRRGEQLCYLVRSLRRRRSRPASGRDDAGGPAPRPTASRSPSR